MCERKVFQYLIFLIVFLITLPSVITLLRPGYFPMQDDMQAFRLQQMDKCFQDFQIPCRFIPDGGYQYGYPQFNFYSPGVYYLGEGIHLLGFQFIDTVKILFILGAFLSSIFAFIFLRTIWGTLPALVGTAFYTYAPVKAVEIYVRGSLSEFWSFVFFPLIFLFVYQLVKTSKLKYLAYTSLSLGLLFITHNLMSFLFLPLFFAWSFFLLWQEKKWKKIYQIIGALVLGLSVAAFFLLPMILEKQFVHVETMLGGYFDYRQHFVTIKELFFSNYFGYGSSAFGSNDDLSLSTGIPHWIAGVLVIIIGFLLRKKFPHFFILALILGVVEAFTLFLIHQRSSFIWDKIPLLAWLQFPWRLLTYSTFLFSISASLLIFLIQEIKIKKLTIFLSIVMIASVFFLHSSFFKPKDWFDFNDQMAFSGQNFEKQLTASIFDYLPIYASLPPNHKAGEVPEIISGQAEVFNYQKASNFQKGLIQAQTPVKIKLPFFDFPGMRVYVDGKEIKHFHDDCSLEDYCLGLVSFNLEAGNHIIEARLTDTLPRKAGNLITLISLILLGGIFLKVYGFQKKIN